MAITNSNRTTVTFAGKEYELEASIGAEKLYADQFRDKAVAPYTGDLWEDMLQVWRDVNGTKEESAHGLPYQLIDMLWAMARAAGSIKCSYDKFYKEIEHSTATYSEFAHLYAAICIELGDGVIFRLEEGQDNAAEPDAE
jgi:hypothetical protein